VSAQDYGDLSDYLVNGDNYQRVDNTLVIPGQWGQKPLVPYDNPDTYRPIGSDFQTCSFGNCALFAHDFFTKLYVILKIAGFDGVEQDCLCNLANRPLATDLAACKAFLQSYVDGSDGQLLTDVFPAWILAEMGLTGTTGRVAFDFWFTGCYSDAFLTLPNLPNQPRDCVQIGSSCWVRL